ncbi:MAG TPA: c-type cytochrome [Burkholderiales bacterium]
MKVKLVAAACGLLAAMPAFADRTADREIARGRYLIHIAGCNDCHTPNYGLSGGKVPEKDWLTGDSLGWQGPWGTTYPANLRLYFNAISEAQWLKTAKTFQTRPPMPWFNVHAMSNADLRAIYRYVRRLGPAGKPAPAYVPPGGTVTTPVVTFPAPPK